jgi:crotonobetainyl-CoA:carnitine CoA-transferase CaiB-like acyl-CoA transferase
MPKLPLEGIRVIDMCVVWAGPFGSALLGDLGAEVVRVETVQYWDVNNRIPGNPDEMRKRAADVAPDATPWDTSPNANSVGRNKRSVTIDLRRPEGQEVFHRLVGVSDIFIENNSPDLVEKLSLTYDVLSKVNSKLIQCSMPAFGTFGPYSRFRAFGANMEAVVGHAMLRGYTDTDPTNHTGVFLADACGGATAAFALMTALYHRNKTGRGQFIDMSQAENVSHTLSQALMDYAMNGRVQSTLGNRDASRAPQGVYRCQGDDAWIAISCGSDAEFAGLCGAMDRADLLADERFAGSLARYANQDALDGEIEAWTNAQHNYTAFHRLQEHGVPASPVLSPADVFADPHLQARGIWQQMTHPAAGTHYYLKSPLSHMSKTPLSIYRPASTLGQDNEYVYKQLLGYSDEEYQWFVDHHHAGTTFLDPKRPAGR